MKTYIAYDCSACGCMGGDNDCSNDVVVRINDKYNNSGYYTAWYDKQGLFEVKCTDGSRIMFNDPNIELGLYGTPSYSGKYTGITEIYCNGFVLNDYYYVNTKEERCDIEFRRCFDNDILYDINYVIDNKNVKLFRK